jgi:hypothetical protein
VTTNDALAFCAEPPARTNAFASLAAVPGGKTSNPMKQDALPLEESIPAVTDRSNLPDAGTVKVTEGPFSVEVRSV